MTKEQMTKILTLISATFPNFELSEARIQGWMRGAGWHDYKLAIVAMDKILASSKFAPVPCDLNSACAVLRTTKEEAITWGAGWEMVVRAVHQHGYLKAEIVMKLLPETVQRAIGGADGFRELCSGSTENNSTIRAQFRQRFETEQKKNFEYKLLPPTIQNILGDNLKTLIGE